MTKIMPNKTNTLVSPFPNAEPIQPNVPAVAMNGVPPVPPQPVYDQATNSWVLPQPQQAPQNSTQESIPQAAPMQVHTTNNGAGLMDQMNAMTSGGGGFGGSSNGALRQINFGNVADSGSGTLLDLKDASGNPIHYEAEVMKVEAKKSAAGNDMISCELAVTFPTRFKGVKLFDNLTFTDKSLWKLKSMSRACGCLSDDGTQFIGASEQDFVGNIVRFDIKHEEYEGVTRNRIASGYEEGRETPGLVPSATGTPAPNFG